MSPVPTSADDLALAQELCDAADAITRDRFLAADLVVSAKPDLTPVTDADRAAEQAISELLTRARPGDGLLGEEFGERGGGAGRRWILDPIDGTKNFVRGVPVWATLLALEVDGELDVAVVSAPALGRRWWAARGVGSFCDGRRLSVSAVARVEDASLSTSAAIDWEPSGRLPAFLSLSRRAWRTRAYGDFWQYVLLAEGALDVSCEPEASLWDLAAPALVVTEAGGRFTDVAGHPGPGGGNAVATNGRLHDQVLAALQMGTGG
jgi:histidinol-phosphatase